MEQSIEGRCACGACQSSGIPGIGDGEVREWRQYYDRAQLLRALEPAAAPQ